MVTLLGAWRWTTSLRWRTVGQTIMRTFKRSADRATSARQPVTEATPEPEAVRVPTSEAYQQTQRILGLSDRELEQVMHHIYWLRRHRRAREKVWNELETKVNG